MTTTQPQILSEVIDLMTQLAGDWEYSGELSPDTRLLMDMGLESLDLVVLGAELQKRYGVLPFTTFLAELGERPAEERDVTIRELVTFVCRHATATQGGEWQ
jgi:acyl carrier protein